jgi:hypothetical protein
MVRVIPSVKTSEGWVTISTPSSSDIIQKNERTSLAVHENKPAISMLLSARLHTRQVVQWF